MVNTATSALPTPDLRLLLEEAYQGRHLHNARRGQPIALEPHDIWVVYRGIVQLSTLHPTGDEAIIGLACAGMPFGLSFTQVLPYDAYALTDVVLMRLHQMELEQSPRLAQGLLQQLSRRLKQTEALLAMTAQRRVEDRLRQLLLLLGQETGHVTLEGIRIGVRLTHQQLANLIGTTRVTVTRLLRQLRQEQWLNIDATKHLVIIGADPGGH